MATWYKYLSLQACQKYKTYSGLSMNEKALIEKYYQMEEEFTETVNYKWLKTKKTAGNNNHTFSRTFIYLFN